MSRTSWLKWMLGSTMVISSAFLVYKLWMTKKKKEKELKSEELKQNVDVYDRMLKSTQIVLCETLDECSAALQTILVNDVKEREGTLAYGFDVETGSTGSSTLNDQKDKKDSRVALIQITSLSRTILFRTVKTTILPKILADFLANPNYLKVGVGINNDAKALYQNFRTQMQGCVDLSDLYYKTVKDPKDSKDSKDIAMTKLQKISLQRLVELLLSLQLPKDFRVRCGAWDSAKLSEEQIRYAAADAFYGREVFLALFNRKQGSISWDIQSLKSWSCSKKDLFASHKVQKQRSESSVNQPQEKKGGSQPKKVFDNCRMEDPNGELLALISKKRCDWYLRANLATKRSDQPLTIRLNFKPKGNGYANDTKVSEYYLEPTKVIC
jgi:hypothetical protein